MPASSAVRLANPYTCLVIGRGVRSSTAAKFTLMWTMMSEPQHAVNFRPDHFALLIRRSDDTVHTVEIQHNNDEGNCANDSSVIMEHCQDEQQQQEQHSDHNDSSIENSRISSVTGEISATATCSTVPTGVSELPRPDGLTTAEVVSMLRNPTAILPRIPYGEKNDVHFAMSNQRNVERRRHGQPNTFDDDCGVWEKKTARYNKYPYLQQDGGILKRVFWNVSMQKYCRETNSSGKHSYVTLEPQPSQDEILTLVRYTVTSVANRDYRRRITWLVSADETPSAVAVVEYFGQHVEGAPHGLCKDKAANEPYVRTPAETMDAISSLTTKQSSKAVYNTLTAELEVDAAPRNAAVVHDKKYRDARKERQNNGTNHCKTFGDEFQCVFNMVQSDKALAEPFVRYVIATGDRVPSVILYTERQIRELKAFCFNGPRGSVLSFDKTFNLGAIYVTVAVYKNLALVRRKTNEHPLFIGPLYLHGHSDAETYSFFFSHIASRLLDCPFSQMTVGADEELAIRKAMSHAFHGALQVTCTRHLKSNGDKKLDSVVGSRSEVRRAVHRALFGSDGLTSCDDVIAFDDKVRQIRNDVFSKAPPAIVQYFDNYLHSLLRDNVVAGRPGWTNNNCESVNHVIKQYTQLRPQHLPDLINKLRDLVRGQYTEADGRYAVAVTYNSSLLTPNIVSPSTHGRRCRLHSV